MLKKQLEQGKLATTGTGGGVAVPGVIHGLMVANMSGQPSDNQIQAPAQSMQEVRPIGIYSSVMAKSWGWLSLF